MSVGDIYPVLVGMFGPAILAALGFAYTKLRKLLTDIHAEVKATNGRVTALEQGQAEFRAEIRGIAIGRAQVQAERTEP